MGEQGVYGKVRYVVPVTVVPNLVALLAVSLAPGLNLT